MILNYSKIIFLIMLIISSIITLSSNNWLGMWMGLEINLMSFIPFISKSKNKSSSQAMMMYFLTQTIGSIILLFAILMKSMIFMSPIFIENLPKIMMMIGILIKTGAAPFHMWLPNMMSNLSWLEAMLLMTWQKVAPLFMLNFMNPNNTFIYIIAMTSAIMGAIGGLNQTSLRKILAYSSINHLGWMLMFMSMNFSWYKYLLLYSIMIMLLCTILSENNIYFMNQVNLKSPSIMEKYLVIMMLLSLGGLPPFIGFLPKWMVIQSMVETNLYFPLILMMLTSLLTLFYYLRILSYIIMSYSTMNNWMSYSPMNKFILYMSYLINLSLPLFSILNF
uniref:NADH-ubiquinone oxidoreductase chain 2 n=1 Tax=Riptortus pedestris TaxID=329032 RepID=B7SML8_RIPPE|nr:NADH dehydrogenase subunit 2 [Riptortus pedestris]ABZ02112.1 NADH dehydrogenase subunit 2 [Riptortus pedestris]